jgi:hypothetical protein
MGSHEETPDWNPSDPPPPGHVISNLLGGGADAPPKSESEDEADKEAAAYPRREDEGDDHPRACSDIESMPEDQWKIGKWWKVWTIKSCPKGLPECSKNSWAKVGNDKWSYNGLASIHSQIAKHLVVSGLHKDFGQYDEEKAVEYSRKYSTVKCYWESQEERDKYDEKTMANCKAWRKQDDQRKNDRSMQIDQEDTKDWRKQDDQRANDRAWQQAEENANREDRWARDRSRSRRRQDHDHQSARGSGGAPPDSRRIPEDSRFGGPSRELPETSANNDESRIAALASHASCIALDAVKERMGDVMGQMNQMLQQTQMQVHRAQPEVGVALVNRHATVTLRRALVVDVLHDIQRATTVVRDARSMAMMAGAAFAQEHAILIEAHASIDTVLRMVDPDPEQDTTRIYLDETAAAKKKERDRVKEESDRSHDENRARRGHEDRHDKSHRKEKSRDKSHRDKSRRKDRK